MTSEHHLVDPDLRAFVDSLPPLDMDAAALAETRATLARLTATIPQEHPDCVVEGATARSPEHDHGVPLVVVRPRRPAPDGPGRTALLWMHGGGYLLGHAEQDVPYLGDLSAELDLVAVSVDYRLAPEHPHPAPVEDCYAALVWVHQHAAELGIDPRRVVLAGQSAGGGLAAALSTLARDRGGPAIARQVLVYPMLDDRTAAEDADLAPHAGRLMWTAASNRFAWTSLLGREPGSAAVSPYAAAARAEDLRGLPATFLDVGALDLFAEEVIDYARRLVRAGVPTDLHVVAGAVHGYAQAGDLPICRDHQARVRGAIASIAGQAGTNLVK